MQKLIAMESNRVNAPTGVGKAVFETQHRRKGVQTGPSADGGVHARQHTQGQHREAAGRGRGRQARAEAGRRSGARGRGKQQGQHSTAQQQNRRAAAGAEKSRCRRKQGQGRQGQPRRAENDTKWR